MKASQLLAALVAAAWLSIGSATEPEPQKAACPVNVAAGENNPAQQGCCSWHDGVCGCSSSGRTECCDGTLSPSCNCNHDEGEKTL